VLGNTRFISRIEHDISFVRCAHSWDNTRNKSISKHPCIILHVIRIVIFIVINKYSTNIFEERNVSRFSRLTLTRGLVSLTLPVYAPDETTLKPMAMIELRKLENTYFGSCFFVKWRANPLFVLNVWTYSTFCRTSWCS
jgi:hypothetical protein